MLNLDAMLSSERASREAAEIDLGGIGSMELGYLTVAEPGRNVPFEVKRAYWTYYTPHQVERGHHAHRELEQVLVAMAGEILITTESVFGTVKEFRLRHPAQGLYVPMLHWRTLRFSHNAVLLSLASLEYDPDEYIRSREEFDNLQRLFQGRT